MKKKRASLNLAGMLHDKRLPIVILDERWHELFDRTGKPAKLQELERKLKDLMKQQGKMVTDVKTMKAAKQKLMEGIVAGMNERNDTRGSKKMDKSQKLIRDINDKLKANDNQLADLPYRIKEANEEVVCEGMSVCYEQLEENQQQVLELDRKITQMREELKRMVIQKQEMEEQNTSIYGYMHDILGSEVMEYLDVQYAKAK